MLETIVARLLQEACQKNAQEKEDIVLCEIVFDYLVSHPNLSATEKLTWLIINKAVRRNPDFICHLSYRMIANAMNVSKDTAYRLVRVLKEQQFLLTSLSEDKNQVRYTTNLPEEGIALLKQALRNKKTTQRGSILTRCCAVLLSIKRRYM